MIRSEISQGLLWVSIQYRKVKGPREGGITIQASPDGEGELEGWLKSLAIDSKLPAPCLSGVSWQTEDTQQQHPDPAKHCQCCHVNGIYLDLSVRRVGKCLSATSC